MPVPQFGDDTCRHKLGAKLRLRYGSEIMPARVPLDVRWRIVTDSHAGELLIPAIARKYRAARDAVKATFAKFLDSGTVEDLDRPGRPRTTTPEQHKELLRIVRQHLGAIPSNVCTAA